MSEPKTMKVENSFDKARKGIEKLSTGTQTEASQALLDIYRTFAKVFNTKDGKFILEYLDNYSHDKFPNYNNVNFNYSKIGEQNLVKHINAILINAKKIK